MAAREPPSVHSASGTGDAQDKCCWLGVCLREPHSGNLCVRLGRPETSPGAPKPLCVSKSEQILDLARKRIRIGDARRVMLVEKMSFLFQTMRQDEPELLHDLGTLFHKR